MKTPVTQQLDLIGRKVSPFAMTALLVVVGMVPLPLPEIGPITPALSMMAVYHWTIFRSDLLPPVAVFGIGLLEDILMGTPLGLTAVILLFVHAFVQTQRRLLYGKSFLVLWLGFLAVAAPAAIVKWAVMAALGWYSADPAPAVFQVLMTVALYPCLAWLLMQAHAAFLREV